jgi:hypothetical protein
MPSRVSLGLPDVRGRTPLLPGPAGLAILAAESLSVIGRTLRDA